MRKLLAIALCVVGLVSTAGAGDLRLFFSGSNSLTVVPPEWEAQTFPSTCEGQIVYLWAVTGKTGTQWDIWTQLSLRFSGNITGGLMYNPVGTGFQRWEITGDLDPLDEIIWLQASGANSGLGWLNDPYRNTALLGSTGYRMYLIGWFVWAGPGNIRVAIGPNGIYRLGGDPLSDWVYFCFEEPYCLGSNFECWSWCDMLSVLYCAPPGACCLGPLYGCEMKSQVECEALGGTWAGSLTNCTGPDCDSDGYPDVCAVFLSSDCNHNGVPDTCEWESLGPNIVTPPQSTAVCVGGQATFTVSATGYTPMEYRWRHNGVPIDGATATTYTVTWVDPLDAGEYDVTVESDCGMSISPAATLTVKQPPKIAQSPTNQSADPNGVAVFQVVLEGTEPLSIQWRKDALPLVDGGQYNGATTTLLTATGVQHVDAGAYDVVVTNECGYAVSGAATLSLNPGLCPPPAPPWFARAYALTGDANNTPWSWRIHSTDGSFLDAVDYHVPGVPAGGALAVAQAFGASVQSYAANNLCTITQLITQTREAFGTTVLAIGAGDRSPFELWVGPADQEPNCRVVPEQLPACGFNPTIAAGPGPEQPAPKVEVSTATAGAGATGAAASRGDEQYVRRTSSRSFGALQQVPDVLSFPARTYCKVWPRAGESFGPYTATMVDPKHVLTDAWRAAHAVDRVCPAYANGSGPWGDFDAVATHVESSHWRVGLIELDRPIGAVTGWMGYGYNMNDWWARHTEFVSHGYPTDSIYDDSQHYWRGYFDKACDENDVSLDCWGLEAQIFQPTASGMEGGGAYPNGESVIYFINSGSGSGDVTFFDWLNDEDFEWVQRQINDDKPDTFDLSIVEYGINHPALDCGGNIGPIDIFVYNYSKATFAGTVPYTIHLSRNNVLDPDDLLLYEGSFTHTFAPLTGTGVTAETVTVPWGEAPNGTNYVIVSLVLADADESNNRTEGLHAQTVQIENPALPAPAHLTASLDTYYDRIEIDWDNLAGATYYEVWRNTTPDVNTAFQLEQLLQTSHYTDSTPEPGVSYYYWVWAWNECAVSQAVAGPVLGRCEKFWEGPSIVRASNGEFLSWCRITWDPVEDATKYIVYRNPDGDPNSNQRQTIGWTEDTHYDDSVYGYGCYPGVIFHYSVQVCHDEQCGPISRPDEGWEGIEPPPNVWASDGPDEWCDPNVICVRADTVEGGGFYQVRRAESADPNGPFVMSGWHERGWVYYDTFYYYDRVIPRPGIVYYYWVRAAYYHEGYAPSDWSGPASGWKPIPAPTPVWAGDGSSTHFVHVTCGGSLWSHLYYRVYRSSGGGAEAFIGYWHESGYFDDTTAEPGVIYQYRVSAATTAWGEHESELGGPDSGWRAFDCDGDNVPDQIDHNAVAPWITQQPLNTVVCLGSPATFSVSAGSAASISYQWRRDGQPISGATGSSYTVPWADPADEVTYDVLLTSNCGQTVSDPVGMSVIRPPVVTPGPEGLVINAGDVAIFTTAADGMTYQWRRNAVPLANDGRISGANTNTLTINAVRYADAGAYDVVVTNECAQGTPPQATVLTVIGDPPPCPLAGPAYVVHTYILSGASTGESWSWRVESPDRSFGTPVVDVLGVSGDALAVAQAFADSINAYATASACSADELSALAGEFGGTIVLSIRAGGDTPLPLFVGPPGGPADCLVEADQPPCAFTTALDHMLLPGTDRNFNGVDDFIDLATGTSQDCQPNGLPDDGEILEGASRDCEADGIPDECQLTGDFNKDGAVGRADLTIFAGAYGQVSGQPGYIACCDVDADGDVDCADWAVVKSHWSEGSRPTPLPACDSTGPITPSYGAHATP